MESAADRRGPPMERRPLKEERHHVREERPGRRTSLASQRPAYKPQGRHFTSRPTMTSRRPQANLTRKETGRDNEVRRKRKKPPTGNLCGYNMTLENILLAEGQNLGIEQWSPKRPTASKQKTPFCAFYKEEGHDTQSCRMLKKILDVRL